MHASPTSFGGNTMQTSTVSGASTDPTHGHNHTVRVAPLHPWGATTCHHCQDAELLTTPWDPTRCPFEKNPFHCGEAHMT